MAERDVTSVLVRMPTRLKRRLAREVTRREATLNDIAVQVLADRFDVPFRPSGRRGTEPGESPSVVLRLPAALRDRIRAHAHERATSANAVIVETLTDAFEANQPPRKDTMTESNGRRNGQARSSDKVRVAVVGVGNCANALVQGIEYYRAAPRDQFVPGLMHVDLGGYHVGDIEFSAAFDVTITKVGEDLGEAIWGAPNDTIRFADVGKVGVKVSRGMTHDGIGKYLAGVVDKAPGETDDVVHRTGAERGLRARELHAGLHRARALLAAALRGARRARHRRRHQVAGGGDDHPPRADESVPRARRARRPD